MTFAGTGKIIGAWFENKFNIYSEKNRLVLSKMEPNAKFASPCIYIDSDGVHLQQNVDGKPVITDINEFEFAEKLKAFVESFLKDIGQIRIK